MFDLYFERFSHRAEQLAGDRADSLLLGGNAIFGRQLLKILRGSSGHSVGFP
jgi:hypothetical protein